MICYPDIVFPLQLRMDPTLTLIGHTDKRWVVCVCVFRKRVSGPVIRLFVCPCVCVCVCLVCVCVCVSVCVFGVCVSALLFFFSGSVTLCSIDQAFWHPGQIDSLISSYGCLIGID